MDGGARFWLGVFVACVGIVAGVWLVTSLFDESEAVRRVETLREELRERRAAVDSCRLAVSQEEMGFEEYDRRVDSLRRRVEGLESLTPGGVPADSYPRYMDAFEAYNRAVPDWSARADTLQAHWRACREVVREHNVLADSLRRVVEEIRRERSGARGGISGTAPAG